MWEWYELLSFKQLEDIEALKSDPPKGTDLTDYYPGKSFGFPVPVYSPLAKQKK